MVMNAAALEFSSTFDIHNEGTQPVVRRATDALDAERIAIREELGYGQPHFPLADYYRTDGEEHMYGRAAKDRLIGSGDWREPIDLYSHRYVHEDIAIGLAFLISMGRYAGVATPVADGLMAIASAMLGEDLTARGGRTLTALGLDTLSRAELADLLENGFA